MCQVWYPYVSGVVPLCVKCGTPMCQVWYPHVSGVVPLCVRCGTPMCQVWYPHVSGVVPLCVTLDTLRTLYSTIPCCISTTFGELLKFPERLVVCLT